MLKDSKNQTTKGFVSVCCSDRSRDIVPPEAFNIPRFMANPQIKYNHTFWKDQYGNEVTVGRALDLFAAEVADIGSNEMWGVRDIESQAVRDSFPKKAFPELMAGDRGLWTYTKYTVPEVWQMIEDGELKAYSWAGNVFAGLLQVGKTSHRVFLDIDLVEYSPVSFPDNPKALFVVDKATGAKVLEPVVFYFNKQVFPGEDSVRQWMRQRGYDLEKTLLIDEEWRWVLTRESDEDVLVSQSFSAEMDRGVIAAACPVRAKSVDMVELLDKGAVEITSSHVLYRRFPLAAKHVDWSFGPEDRRFLRECGDEIYDSVFARRGKDGQFPHHKFVDGEVRTVLKGVVAAWAQLSVAEIGDKSSIFEHLEKHYIEFGVKPPSRDLGVDALVEYHKKFGLVVDVEAVMSETEPVVETAAETPDEDKAETAEASEVKAEETQAEQESPAEQVVAQEGAEQEEVKQEDAEPEDAEPEVPEVASVEKKLDALTEVVTKAIERIEGHAGQLTPVLKQLADAVAALKPASSVGPDESETKSADTEDVPESIGEVDETPSGNVSDGFEGVKAYLEQKFGEFEKRFETLEKAVPASGDHHTKSAETKSERAGTGLERALFGPFVGLK